MIRVIGAASSFVFIAVLGLALLTWSGSSRAGGGFAIEDAASVSEAVAEITSTLERQGFEIVAVIDHAANAAGVGRELRPTTVILARDPRSDLRLLRRGQTLGIDLPLKFLVWEDEVGEIRLKFNDVGYLTDRHDIRLRDFQLRRLDRVMEQFGGLDRGLLSIESAQSVAATVAVLRGVLEAAGFAIPVVIDYRADSGRSGLYLRPTTLMIFGNPNVGTQLMQNRQEIGLDLPQKFLVWENWKGEVQIAWNDPAFVAQRAGVQGLETLLSNIANALANFAAAGAAL